MNTLKTAFEKAKKIKKFNRTAGYNVFKGLDPWSREPEIERMSIEEYLKIPEVHCQRNTNLRINKIAKLLKQKYWPQLLVFIVKYPDGKKYVIDGNTRREIWRQSEKFDVDRPSHVYAFIHGVSNDDEARDLYYTFDNAKAAEKMAEKFQGDYKSLSMNIESSKLERGRISKCLEFAVAGNPEMGYTNKKEDNYHLECIKHFRNELQVIDNIIRIGKAEFFNAAVISTFLMLLKFKGTVDERLIKAIKLLSSEKNEGINCPITFIQNEYINNKYIPVKGTAGDQTQRQIDFLLYCLNKFLNKKKMKNFKQPREYGGKRDNLYYNFWNK